MKKRFLLLLGISLTLRLTAQEKDFFTNPVIRGDIPDPSMIRVEDTYYVTGTSSEWAPFYPIFTSKDLINWEQTGHVFNKRPSWTSNSFWAPELFYRNGKMYCYYTARQKSSGISYIGVASAETPFCEFVDHGPVVEYGTEAIDAFVYDDGGQLYITWKAYGLDKRPIELLGCKLSADGLHLDGKSFSLLKDDEGIGMEGQYHFKSGDYYYIIYSAHGCCGPHSNYDVYVARSRNFRGPYEKYAGNPVLHGGEGDYISCGHGTAVKTPDGRMFYMCHAYLKGEEFYVGRQPVLQEMEVTDDSWVRFKTGTLAVTRQPLPFKGSRQEKPADFEDRFDGDRLKVGWTWNYPYAEADILVKNGKLYLSGMSGENNRYGTALCLRPQSSCYSVETEMLAKNGFLQGLTLYGDNQNLVVWGTEGDRLLLKAVRDGSESVLYESVFIGKKVFLKMEVEQGCILHFYESPDGKAWKSVPGISYDAGFLVRWDRVQRPGLLYNGDGDVPAEFAYFKMKHLK